MIKQCNQCKRFLPTEDFQLRKDSKDGFRGQCKYCRSKNTVEWYRNNPKARIKRDENRRKNIREWMDEIKSSNPCSDCKKIFPPCVMDWDHLPGSIKTKPIAVLVKNRISKTTIMKELEKCELVCANCHRIRTFTRKVSPEMEQAIVPSNVA